MEAQKPTRQQREILENLSATLGTFEAAPPYAEASAAVAAPAGRRKNPRALIVAASRIRVDLSQVRQKDREHTSERIQELAASIQAVGLQQPPGVREAEDGMYEVVYGEGRFVAMTQVLGWQEIEVMRTDVKEEDLLWHQLHENIHRTNLDPLDLAQAVAQAREQGYSLAQIAERLAKSKAWVSRALSVGENLGEEAREALARSQERQAMDTAYAIAQLPQEKQAGVAKEVVEKKLSRREAEALAASARTKRSKDDPPARGRRKNTTAFETTLRAANGARVTVAFRKSEVTPAEVIATLDEVLQTLRKQAGSEAA